MKNSLLGTILAMTVISAHGQDHLQAPATQAARIEAEDAQMKSLIFAKSFCVAVRRNHQPQNSAKLLKFIDPAYLKEHQIDANSPELETFPLFNIYDIKISADPKTILCIVDTRNGPRQALLLRTKFIEGEVFLDPVRPPSKTDQSFAPWILHMQTAPAPPTDKKVETTVKDKRLVAGLLEYFPQDVKSVEAWEGNEFKIADTPILPGKEVSREELLKWVGKKVSVSGSWHPGETRTLTEEEKLHSRPLSAEGEGEGDIVGAGLEARSIRKTD